MPGFSQDGNGSGIQQLNQNSLDVMESTTIWVAQTLIEK